MSNPMKLVRHELRIMVPDWMLEEYQAIADVTKSPTPQHVMVECLGFLLQERARGPVTRDQFLDLLHDKILALVKRSPHGCWRWTVHDDRRWGLHERLIGQAIDDLVRWGFLREDGDRYHYVRPPAAVIRSRRRKRPTKRTRTRQRKLPSPTGEAKL